MSLFAGSFHRRGAEADSMVQTVRRTFFFLSVHGGHVLVVLLLSTTGARGSDSAEFC